MSHHLTTPPTPDTAAPIDATPYIALAAPRRRRPRFGKLARVMLSGATVDVSTQRQIERWRGKSLSLGLLTDQLVAFAKKKHFAPNRPRK